MLKYRADIDGLRSVAVLPVVFYHAGFPGPSGGFIGVDVFFVISGFLITSIIAREIAGNHFSLLGFYERRARRILPAMVVVMAFCLGVGWLILMPRELQQLGQSALATAVFLSNMYFLKTLDYFSPAAEFAPLLHTWSLAVEEQFYLIFPLILVALAWRRSRNAPAVIAALSALSFLAAVLMLPRNPEWVFYGIMFRAWELGAGAMLALLAPRPPGKRAVRELLGVAGLALILVPVFAYDASMPFPGAAAAPPVLGTVLLIWIGAQQGGSIVNRLLATRGPVWIGLISYSLYLWHWPIIVFIRLLLDRAVLPTGLAIAAVLASLLLAWLSYRFVERPFRKQPAGGFRRATVFAMAGGSLAGLIAVGGMLHLSGGVPARFPSEVTAIAAYGEDSNPRRRACLGRLPSEQLCRIGLEGEPGDALDYLLWGDSHADAIMASMDMAGTRAGKRGVFAGRSICPPVLGIERQTNGEACTAFNREVWSWLEARPDIRVVILHARWAHSVEGSPPLGEAAETVRLKWIGNAANRPATTDNAALLEAGLAETVDAILASGRRVVLVGPVPEIGRHVPYALARHAALGWTPMPSLSRADFEARSRRTEEILQRIARARADVSYVPLSDLFCDEAACRLRSDKGYAYYRDDDHISQTAAKALVAPRMDTIWNQ